MPLTFSKKGKKKLGGRLKFSKMFSEFSRGEGFKCLWRII
jgi:hypothetical protein